MIDLRNNKIFFISLIISIVLHVTILSGLSGVSVFSFLNPVLSKVITVHLEDTGTVTREMTWETGRPLMKDFLQKHNMKKTSSLEDNNRPEQTETPSEENPKTKSENRLVMGSVAHSTDEKLPEAIPADKEKGSQKATEEVKNAIAENVSSESPKNRESRQILTASRETFYYDIYWLGIHVGDARLNAINNNGMWRITSQVHSAPVISAFYKVDDFAESTLLDGIPVNFRIKQHEGNYSSDKETIFDMHHKIITFFNYLKGTKDEHALKDGISWDVISGFYYLRTQPLEVGKPVYINIFDSNKFYKAKIDVLKKEKIEAANSRKIDTVVVKPSLESEGLFQKRGDILIWLTDDEKRIPVKVETKVAVGSVVAELRDFAVEE